ncbi:putative membrane mmpL11 domain protein [Mycobacterium xenopi 4042]|uniref:Putative membrane mmpL11 domain protein n=1 Tax=Mycobacterium xenopi 4042 TaxID=1299334 RepID=X8BIJ3_MYCXE|nr:putative membrane mmpL11 domain protein [Mycobacterium xenopi 4042]
MVLGNSLLRQFDSTHEIRAGVASAAQALGPGRWPVQVLVSFSDGQASSLAHQQTLAAIGRELARAPDVVSVTRRCSPTTTAVRC